MDLLANFLLAVGALTSALYCYVLSRRLKRFNDLREGMGGAVAVLSAQVDEMTRTLRTAQTVAEDSAGSLKELTERAERAARRLELTLASLHDLPSEERGMATDMHAPPKPSAATGGTADTIPSAGPPMFRSDRNGSVQ